MKEDTRRFLEEFQEELREKAEREEIDYTNDSIYGMALLLDSALREGFTTTDAVNEFIENSNLEVQVNTVETQVIQK